MRVLGFDYNDTEDGTDYEILYEVTDPSGVKQVTFRKAGDDVKTQKLGGRPSVTTWAEFHIGPIESNIDTLTGTAVKVQAEDTHGVEGSKSAYQRANFAGSVAEKLGKNGIDNAYVAYNFGILSGFSTSLGGTARSVKQSAEGVLATIENPEIIVEGIKKFIAVLKKYEVLEFLTAIIKQSLDSVQEKQEINNPYGEESNEHLVYEGSWYTGYVAGMLAKTVASGGASKFAKSNTYLKRVRKLVKKTPPGRLASYIATKRANAKAKVAGQLVSGSTYAGGKVVRGAKTVGSAVRTNKLVDRAGVDTSKLSSGRAAALRPYLKTDDDAADDVDDLDSNEVDDVFSLGTRCRVSSASASVAVSARDCGLDISKKESNELYSAVEEFDVDVQGFYRHIRGLSPKERAAVSKVISEYEVGGKVIVSTYKYSRKLPDQVPDPEDVARDIVVLKKNTDVQFYNLKEIATDDKRQVKGHAYEITVAREMYERGYNIKKVGKNFGSFETDVLAVGDDGDELVVEVKNLNFNDRDFLRAERGKNSLAISKRKPESIPTNLVRGPK